MTAKRLLLGASFSVLAASGAAAAPVGAQATTWTFVPGYSSSWLPRIGVTSGIEAQANGGLGFVIGLVDTGVMPTQMDVTGRVSALSSCAALTFACPSSYVDDNGHGTATASVAAGAVTSTGLGMSGVAPRATILEEKVLNKSGSGYDIDVANGIVKAANAGAQVINLSLSYIPTASVLTAVNTATAKGAILVWAGGNSAQALNGGANTTGLAGSALNHLVFVGSLNAANGLSSFSNTPGAGYAIAGTAKASYASLWLMAPGENIIAPGIQYGPTSFAYWSGTSLAAPMVAGALGLLETTWPVLSRNGTATQVLFQTATDLGAPGVDSIYGNGLMNVTKAFQPIGTMSVVTANGASVPVSQLTLTMLTGGAAGSLSSLTAILSNYTGFDSFQRNFTVDLSGLLKTGGTVKTSAQAALTPAIVTNTTHLDDGRTLTLSMAANRMLSLNEFPGADGLATAERASSPYGQASGAWMFSLTDTLGTNIAVGHGFPASASFAQAIWGGDSFAAGASYAMQGTNDLLNLAEGGHFMAFGAAIGENTRIGFSTSEAGAPDYVPLSGPIVPHATAVSIGATTKLADGWLGGVTLSALDEQYGLLGTLYNPNSALGFGSSHRSMSVGLSTALELWKDGGLLFNAALARTDAAQGQGLIQGTSALLARSYGMALVQDNLITANDHFSLSLSKPLRVFGGAVDVATTTVDGEGYAHTGSTAIAIHPDGNETDVGIGYARFWSKTNVTASLAYRQDADNLKGVNDLVLRIGTGFRF